MISWDITVSQKGKISNVVAAVWGNGNQGQDAWGYGSTANLTASVNKQVVTLTSDVAGAGDTETGYIMRYNLQTDTALKYCVTAGTF